MRTNRTLVTVASVFTLMLCSAGAWAMFMAPQGTPVDRLVKNISAYVMEHPDDANAHYLLGRVHALAFQHNRDVVGTYPKRGNQEGGLPNVADDHLQRYLRTVEPQPRPQPEGRAPRRGRGGEPVEANTLTEQQKVEHLAASIESYLKAIELDATQAHYHNGLAFVLDKGREYAGRVAPPKLDGEMKPTHAEATEAFKTLHEVSDEKPAAMALLDRYWREAAIEKYMAAFKLASEKDAKIRFHPIAGLNSLVSFEAGNAYIRLLGERENTEAEAQSIAMVKRHLEALKNKQQGPVTPIVFNIERELPLAMLLDAGRTVRFDLDGDGVAERRPWVQPDTAILCWDPAGTGKITSGKQLFGSVTFHLYPGDGYTAMNLLDDDRDGKLSGAELPGLAVWFDRNGDGVSDAGEVVPIERTPIESLSVHALSREGEAPSNPFGLRRRDGRILPTYDWIAPAVER